MNPRYERWRWITFGITWIIYAGFYLTRQVFSVTKKTLLENTSIGLDRNNLGEIDALNQIAYMIGQFVFGAAGDRFGPRRLLFAGMSLSIAVAVACGFATAAWMFFILLFLQGLAQSTGWTNVNKAMSSWFSFRERGRVLGWWCTNYPMGAFLGTAFAGGMIALFSTDPQAPYWQAAFWGAAVALGVVLILAVLFLHNRPEDKGLPSIEEYHGEPESLIDEDESPAPAPEGSWLVIQEVLASPVVWVLAFAYLSIKLVRYAIYYWGAMYAQESLGEGAFVGALTVAVFPIGGMFGVVAAGYISDKFFQSRRAPWAILSLLLLALLMFFGLRPIHNPIVMGGFFFLIGLFLFGPDSTVCATAAVDFGTKRGAGTATGIVNCVGSIGGILGGYLPGRITTEGDWTPLYVVFQVSLLISALILLPLWRSKPPQK